MALRKRTGARFEANAWAGFVDAMTALLLVMVFTLSVFMIMQYFLRETIGAQGRELASLEGQLATLAQTLGAREVEIDSLRDNSTKLENRLTALQFEYDQSQSEIASFEAQIASLIARNQDLSGVNAGLIAQNEELAQEVETAKSENQTLIEEGQIYADLEAQNLELLSEKEKLELTLAQMRSQMSEDEIESRRAAAELEALEAMVASMRDDFDTEGNVDNDEISASIAQVMALASLASTPESDDPLIQELNQQTQNLSELERRQFLNTLATEFVRERLKNAETELTAMTLALEEERKNAEETLTLLAAIESERENVENSELSQAEKDAALLELARQELSVRERLNEEDAQRIELLNRQTADLRTQLGALQNLIDQQVQQDIENDIDIATFGNKLNAALAASAAQFKARADDLETYRSDFFGKLREVLSGIDGVEVVGDRFVFSSEVLFAPGSAELSDSGRGQIGQIALLINELSLEIPADIDWVLRVDGHTDNRPISSADYQDNWELSQARALSVVRFMINAFGVRPDKLAATGFGEYHPIDTGTSEQALERNRRIEFKLTQR